jgi:mannosyl-3-phosphoglycerate phosphatase family protein
VLVVFSDLDGTILDSETYGCDKSRPGIELLKTRGVPLVLVSSKTFFEMKEIHAELRLGDPFIFENGGGIAYPDGNGDFRIGFPGMMTGELTEKFQGIKDFFPGSPRTILEMGEDEIAERTGLSRKRAGLARMRKASLPFIMDAESGSFDLDKINSLLSGRGLSIMKGKRFFYLMSADTDKGTAVGIIRGYYKKIDVCGGIETAGIGDSPLDLPLLYAVDRAFLVRGPDGSVSCNGIPGKITVTDGAGPEGFTEAVKKILS